MTTESASLPLPTKEYDQAYMNKLIRQLNTILTKMNSVHPLIVGSDLSQQVVGYPISGLTIINIPKSSANLPSGSVWSDGGVLKIVS